MNREQELIKEIEKLDNFATKNIQTHNCTFDEGLVGYKERYYLLKAELKGITETKSKLREDIEPKLEIWVNKWITKRVTSRAVAELKNVINYGNEKAIQSQKADFKEAVERLCHYELYDGNKRGLFIRKSDIIKLLEAKQ